MISLVQPVIQRHQYQHSFVICEKSVLVLTRLSVGILEEGSIVTI